MPERRRLLIVEDNPQELQRCRDALAGIHQEFQVATASTLVDALERLRGAPIDLVVLDLILPDSAGLPTLEAVHAATRAPVIVLTSIDDMWFAQQALDAGAHDYLVKQEVTSQSLERSIRYAIDLQRVAADETTRAQDVQTRELETYAALGEAAAVPVTAGTVGLSSLREAQPAVFAELVRRYQQLVKAAIDERTYKVDRGSEEQLRLMAERLGAHEAGPRDVVDLHLTVLRSLLDPAQGAPRLIVIDEARLLLVRLMGHTLAHYRTRAIAVSRVP